MRKVWGFSCYLTSRSVLHWCINNNEPRAFLFFNHRSRFWVDCRCSMAILHRNSCPESSISLLGCLGVWWGTRWEKERLRCTVGVPGDPESHFCTLASSCMLLHFVLKKAMACQSIQRRLFILCTCAYICLEPQWPIFEGQPPKTRPFPIKTRVMWVLIRYIISAYVQSAPAV